MNYLVVDNQNLHYFSDANEAAAKTDETGGDLWVSWDIYMQEVYPEYKMELWAKYYWKKLKKELHRRFG